MSNGSEAGVLVITTTKNVYQAANGVSFGFAASMTGELAVTVFGTPAGEDTEGPVLAAFGNTEVVYLAGEVTVVAPAPAAAKSMFGQ
jgi:hypothetical protein